MAVGDPCLICEATIPPYKGHWRNERISQERRTCSKSCAFKLAFKEGRKKLPNPANSWGEGNTNWKGGIKWAGPYKMIRVPPGTPGATKKGYMMEHRYVLQNHIGRPLEVWEQVHHRNGVKADNRVENLEIVTHARPNGVVICPHCRKSFPVH